MASPAQSNWAYVTTKVTKKNHHFQAKNIQFRLRVLRALRGENQFVVGVARAFKQIFPLPAGKF